MHRNLKMLSVRLRPAQIRRIRCLSHAALKRLFDAYGPSPPNDNSRSATIRALIDCGLDVVTNPPYLTALEAKSCPNSTTPRLLTSDAPATD